MKVNVRVTTRAARSEITGWTYGALAVRLAAPPVDGKANDELIRLVARALRLRQMDVQIVKGQSSRNKTLEVAADPADVMRLGK
jgi:uncharacterized protein (TIGR00251 family)